MATTRPHTQTPTQLSLVDDIPPETRLKIYRYLFVANKAVTKTEMNRVEKYQAELSSQFLRCCSTIHSEGLPVLLGSNTFTLQSAVDIKLLRNLVPCCSYGLFQHLERPKAWEWDLEHDLVSSMLNQERVLQLTRIPNLKTFTYHINVGVINTRALGISGARTGQTLRSNGSKSELLLA